MKPMRHDSGHFCIARDVNCILANDSSEYSGFF